MFLAIRELKFARGRFGLMGAVVSLIAILMVLLSGLSSGLVNDGVSGLKSLPVTAFAFDEGTKTDNAFSRSVVDAEQVDAWKSQPGVKHADPVGAGMTNATTDDGTQIDLSLFGIEPDSFLTPAVSEGEHLSGLAGIVVSETAKSDGLELGTIITLDRLDTELEVIGFTEGQATFGHVDMAYLHLDTWKLIASGAAQPGTPTQAQVDALDFEVASVVALQAEDGEEIDMLAGDLAAGTTTVDLKESFNSSPGYEAETLTLSMIQVFLYGICALVVGAFFTVWTIQRQHELAVLRAVGASGRYLLRDSLTQAAILLLSFTALGVAAGVGLGSAMPDGMPFALEAEPILTSSIITIVLGLVGAAVAVLRITRIDPNTALGGQR
ncbi:putative ABC transport system permease protein [Leucobacter exalbidus]|uniref:ABC transport system permease protein n=1 Tax=Leucobacter exalbidus TaxID=662960 RepID=A0A940PNG3_9MICO|nr:ABC transporter permease [Leucobacter exalbidus]MBP1326393.1 putative ABC transport system permease protein [Leucobacter exalbidus]